MPTKKVNGIEIAYERHGPKDAPVICLVQGLGMTLSAWPVAMIDGLVACGYSVLTLDNRDIGHSQLMNELGMPKLISVGLRHKLHMKIKAPYTMTDMMKDTAGLIVALGLSRVHVVGVSMGGMISQLLAIHRPDLVASLTSIMSSTGNRRLPGPVREVRKHIMSRPESATREARLAFSLKTWDLISSPAFPREKEEMRQFVSDNMDRGVTAAGVWRQTVAIMASPSRVPDLMRLKVSALVIHGQEDPLVRVECGEDTARAIQGAKLHVIQGMGHDLPPQLMERFVQLIAGHVNTSEAAHGDRT